MTGRGKGSVKYSGMGRTIAPNKLQVEIWFIQKGQPLTMALGFFNFFASREWKNQKGEEVSNWKVLAWQWIWSGRI